MRGDRDGDREAARRPSARPRLILALLAACLPPGSAASVERLAPGASSCSECHGSGHAEDAMPSLDKLSASEIEAALDAFRSGRRGGTIMPRIAKGFTRAEARAIAASLARNGTAAP